MRTALAERRFVCSAELVLGRDHTVAAADAFVKDAAAQPDGIKVISLTDLPGGHPSLPPEAFAERVLGHGLTPLAHVTGKDGNRSFVEGRLHAFALAGVENILALTGDAQQEGFLGRGKPVYDLDSALILRLVSALREGLEYSVGARTQRSTRFDFFPGAVVNPFKVREPDLMMQLYKLRLKIAMGARFIVTQAGFNLRKLYELKQYMDREGLGEVPVLANVYVPTATIARMMHAGDLAGCVASADFVKRVASESKAQRLERASLMVAAARDLGFAGAHIGGFGLSHGDFMTILERSAGAAWRNHLDNLVFPYPGEFYLFQPGADGLSEATGPCLAGRRTARPRLMQRLSRGLHRWFIAPGTFSARFFEARLRPGSAGENGVAFWTGLLGASSLFRKAALGCQSCGDCVQDHLGYAGCSMRWCYKELRNGPCGGSRVDGSCEAHPELPCLWNLVYEAALACGEDPADFARTLIPPRDWSLDRSNALANRFAGTDNLSRRVPAPGPESHGDT
ncbi:MAG: methylenetetrahydrofolate reductase C-terminal domain-containing protein [Bryobacteraceae bacterium]